MTIYFAGGEDSSFTLLGTGAGSTDSRFYRSLFARGSVTTSGAASSAYPPPNSMQTPFFTPITSFWVHGQFWNNTISGTLNNVLMALADASGVGRILIRSTATAGQLKISTRNAAGTITDLVTSAAGVMHAMANGATDAYDLFVNYATAGQVTLYINGVNVLDTGASVNVTTDSATQLSTLLLANHGNANTCAWSEVIVQDTDTRGMALFTVPPIAAGTTQSWLPNTVANVNAAIINDANLVGSATANQLMEWTVATTLPTGTWTIAAVVQEARVSGGTSGPGHFEWLIRTSDGSDHVSGSIAPLTSPSNYSNIWATNPHTGAAWAAGEFIQAGLESLT